MAKKKSPLLKAVEYNWGLHGPGDWDKVRWLIFTDGAYEVVSTFNPSFEAYEQIEETPKWHERPKQVRKKTTGRLADEVFSKLQEAIKRDPWRDLSLEVCACDGVAWEIESYRDDGSIEKTSGKLDYIYGHRVLETIVSLLPSDGGIYSSSAFISVGKKDE